jgi:hypothetical protein
MVFWSILSPRPARLVSLVVRDEVIAEGAVTETEWLVCCDVSDMFEHVLTSASARKIRLLGCACVRWAWEWGLQEPLPEAVGVAEAFADGLATDDDLRRVASEMGVLWREHDEPYRPYPRTCELTEALALPDNERAWLGEINAYSCDMNIADEPEWLRIVEFVHDIFGNPFRPVSFAPEWRTDTTLVLARQIYESRDIGAMPILADALEEAGCTEQAILDHLRGSGPHVRGCWPVDLILGRE